LSQFASWQINRNKYSFKKRRFGIRDLRNYLMNSLVVAIKLCTLLKIYFIIFPPFLFSSLHGLKYISEDGRHWTERVLWLILCLMGFVLNVYFIGQFCYFVTIVTFQHYILVTYQFFVFCKYIKFSLSLCTKTNN
jgi:hypothetical protein